MRRNLLHLIISTISIVLVYFLMILFWESPSGKLSRRAQYNQDRLPPHSLPVARGSVTLSDGSYTYHLNFSQFQLEFPYLQTYRCSLTLTPHLQPEEEMATKLLLMAIKSHPSSGARRAALRSTWARRWEVEDYRVKPIFLVAETEQRGAMEMVRAENEEFGDILQWDFTEGHHNLSLKERCFLEWLHLRLPHVAFVFKGDDDEYANPEALVLYAREHDAFPQTLHGHIQYDTRVMREAKYRISETLYPFHRFPLFLSGGGFMFPGTSVLPLYQASQKLPVFPLDDVYVGFLSLAANLTYRNDARFIVVRREFNPCLYKLALVVHGIQSDELVKIWKEVQNACCKAAPPNGKC
ncbi:N-acetyllactosaminide beta-1,3-N-acetylglucosaminyltransferase 3-like [Xenopus tropicalis]|nr:N-acetyllactosaminide beta-1,3-N-acetylglucosaminyltransferase 3-like [Xenopus tropicalis]XP_031755469.1 N-acetyllactosaminide beta-1,3-N-acetylglucosaminyltransferase 3-like [Xenopus tropicalis]